LRRQVVVPKSVWTVVLVGFAAAIAGCGGGGSSSGTVTESTAAPAAESGSQAVSAEDCSTLGSVVADFTVGAHAADLIPVALDVTATDYVTDRDFLADYAGRAPEAIRADVELLGRWVAGYATAAQSAGVDPGAVPTLDELTEINTASHLDSREQDLLPSSIQALALWADRGCSGDRPVIEATPPPAEETETVTTYANPLDQASSEAAVGESVDEVADAVNEVMSQSTERELGSPPLGSEVRDCRKERDMSENSLIGPGGAGYVCEVWHDGELYSDSGIAVIDAEGRVATTP
jgi:hypothetical protein